MAGKLVVLAAAVLPPAVGPAEHERISLAETAPAVGPVLVPGTLVLLIWAVRPRR